MDAGPRSSAESAETRRDEASSVQPKGGSTISTTEVHTCRSHAGTGHSQNGWRKRARWFMTGADGRGTLVPLVALRRRVLSTLIQTARLLEESAELAEEHAQRNDRGGGLDGGGSRASSRPARSRGRCPRAFAHRAGTDETSCRARFQGGPAHGSAKGEGFGVEVAARGTPAPKCLPGSTTSTVPDQVRANAGSPLSESSRRDNPGTGTL